MGGGLDPRFWKGKPDWGEEGAGGDQQVLEKAAEKWGVAEGWSLGEDVRDKWCPAREWNAELGFIPKRDEKRDCLIWPLKKKLFFQKYIVEGKE